MEKKIGNLSSEHISVLSDTLAEQIKLPTDAAVVDTTVGHGGHSVLFGKKLGPEGILLGLDVDENCIKRARLVLSSLECKVLVVRENFSKIAEAMTQNGIEKAYLIIADLGVCSAQLSDPERGLSFQENMPLDMRLDERIETTAADIVNQLSQDDLADLIYEFGQDRASRRIARFIVQNRQAQPITTTGQLAGIVCKALSQPAAGRRWQKIHPATRTFQALRIAVNQELQCLKKLLEDATGLLKKGGLIAVVSFHSLEDKIVKEDFKANKLKDVYEVLTKKPLVASRSEVIENPRSRSAKLRIARRK